MDEQSIKLSGST